MERQWKCGRFTLTLNWRCVAATVGIIHTLLCIAFVIQDIIKLLLLSPAIRAKIGDSLKGFVEEADKRGSIMLVVFFLGWLVELFVALLLFRSTRPNIISKSRDECYYGVIVWHFVTVIGLIITIVEACLMEEPILWGAIGLYVVLIGLVIPFTRELYKAGDADDLENELQYTTMVVRRSRVSQSHSKSSSQEEDELKATLSE